MFSPINAIKSPSWTDDAGYYAATINVITITAPAGTPKASTKVVARELCSIVTKGTITPSFLRGDSLSDTEQLFLLAVTEGVCCYYSNSANVF